MKGFFVSAVVRFVHDVRRAQRKPAKSGAPDAISAGWAWYVQQQVAERDNSWERAMKWIRDL